MLAIYNVSLEADFPVFIADCGGIDITACNSCKWLAIPGYSGTSIVITLDLRSYRERCDLLAYTPFWDSVGDLYMHRDIIDKFNCILHGGGGTKSKMSWYRTGLINFLQVSYTVPTVSTRQHFQDKCMWESVCGKCCPILKFFSSSLVINLPITFILLVETQYNVVYYSTMAFFIAGLLTSAIFTLVQIAICKFHPKLRHGGTHSKRTYVVNQDSDMLETNTAVVVQDPEPNTEDAEVLQETVSEAASTTTTTDVALRCETGRAMSPEYAQIGDGLVHVQGNLEDSAGGEIEMSTNDAYRGHTHTSAGSTSARFKMTYH